jgi:hypothetical protein
MDTNNKKMTDEEREKYFNDLYEKFAAFWEDHHCCKCEDEICDCKHGNGYWTCGLCSKRICEGCLDWKDTNPYGYVCHECEPEVDKTEFCDYKSEEEDKDEE